MLKALASDGRRTSYRDRGGCVVVHAPLTLRVHTSSPAVTMIGEPLLAGLLTEHPHVQLDVVVSAAPVDIVAEGFDAGSQLGEVIDKDMIAVPGERGPPARRRRRAVLLRPARRACAPARPRGARLPQLAPTADTPPYRWEFTENRRDFSVAVRAPVPSTDATLNRRLASAGLGVTLSIESHARYALELGELLRVLERFCEPFPGYYLYYPQRRHASRALRALIEHLRRWKQAGRNGSAVAEYLAN